MGSGRCACWPGCLRFKIFLPAAVPSQAAEQGGGALAPREERTVALSSSFAFSASRETFCQPWTPGIRGPRGEKGLGRCEKCSRGHGARQEEAGCLHQVSLSSSPPSLALHPLLSLLGDLNVSANSAVPRCRVVVPTSFFTLRRGVNHPTLESALREGGAGAIKQPVKFLKPPACSQVCKQVSQTC